MPKMETFGEDEKVLEFCPEFPKQILKSLIEHCSKFSLLDETQGCPGAASDLGDQKGSGFIEAEEQKKTKTGTVVILAEIHG